MLQYFSTFYIAIIVTYRAEGFWENMGKKGKKRAEPEGNVYL